MSAKEMFEKLGYEKYERYDDTGYYIEYFKTDEECDNIIFYESKTFSIGEYCLCDMRILQAINQQIKELNWLEDK